MTPNKFTTEEQPNEVPFEKMESFDESEFEAQEQSEGGEENCTKQKCQRGRCCAFVLFKLLKLFAALAIFMKISQVIAYKTETELPCWSIFLNGVGMLAIFLVFVKSLFFMKRRYLSSSSSSSSSSGGKGECHRRRRRCCKKRCSRKASCSKSSSPKIDASSDAQSEDLVKV